MAEKQDPTVPGIVVDHKESGVRYAVSPGNFDTSIHDKVRDLKPWETVRAYHPRRKERANSDAPSTTVGNDTPAASPEVAKATPQRKD